MRESFIISFPSRRLLFAALILVLLFFGQAISRGQSVSIDLSQVGNPGNQNDSATGYGAVGYSYEIGAFDVTLSQYAAFLNDVAVQADPYGLYNSELETDGNVEGISQSGSLGDYKYSVIGSSGNLPVTYVSWLDAARFCNWLENGQPTTGVENTNTTESGSYNLDGDVSNGLETAIPGAIWRLPTENEWYKAAYYDGATGGYSLYATQSNSTPGNLPGSGPNEANYYSGIFSATQTSGSSASQIYLTPVGTFSGSKSYYGTYDQGGDIYQWNDAIIGASRGVRGGAWDVAASDMESTSRSSRVPTGEHDALGFRVVEAIPEPASALLIPAGLAGLALLRRKPVIGEI